MNAGCTEDAAEMATWIASRSACWKRSALRDMPSERQSERRRALPDSAAAAALFALALALLPRRKEPFFSPTAAASALTEGGGCVGTRAAAGSFGSPSAMSAAYGTCATSRRESCSTSVLSAGACEASAAQSDLNGAASCTWPATMWWRCASTSAEMSEPSSAFGAPSAACCASASASAGFASALSTAASIHGGKKESSLNASSCGASAARRSASATTAGASCG